MKNRLLKTDDEYNEACERLYSLIQSTSKPIEADSKIGEEIEFLALLIEKYESKHFRLDAPNPIEAIKFRMEQMNLKQIDIAPLFGGKTRVSEVLNGKRKLNLKMIILLNKYLGIPFESLIQSNEEANLEPNTIKELLVNESIKEYVLNSPPD